MAICAARDALVEPSVQSLGLGLGVAAADADVLQHAVVQLQERAALAGALVGGGEPVQYGARHGGGRGQARRGGGVLEFDAADHDGPPWFDLRHNLVAGRRDVAPYRFDRVQSVGRRFAIRRRVDACRPATPACMIAP
jgi:hypothetical protein